MTELYKANAGAHPITPPLALIDQWWDEAKQNAKYDEPIGPLVAIQAARWGADRELEDCCEWFICDWTDIETADKLRAARRPKPLSLKEQALEAQRRMWSGASNHDDWDLVRRAIEQLPDAL